MTSENDTLTSTKIISSSAGQRLCVPPPEQHSTHLVTFLNEKSPRNIESIQRITNLISAIGEAESKHRAQIEEGPKDFWKTQTLDDLAPFHRVDSLLSSYLRVPVIHKGIALDGTTFVDIRMMLGNQDLPIAEQYAASQVINLVQTKKFSFLQKMHMWRMVCRSQIRSKDLLQAVQAEELRALRGLQSETP